VNEPEQDVIEQNIYRAAAITMHCEKIGEIVARESQADMEKVKALRWFVRYGWMILLFGALLLAYGIGII